MSQTMQIKFTAVESNSRKSAKGKEYIELDVSFRNLSFDNKPESKKLYPFVHKVVYDTLKNAQPGDIFTVEREKNENGFWDWINIKDGNAQEAPQQMTTPKAAGGNPTPKSNYETAEERALRQVYIIRQSSIANAINTIKTEKNIPSVADVLAIAQQYEDYVFGTKASEPEQLPVLDDEDDIPY